MLIGSAQKCPTCGAELSAEPLEGLCPACVLGAVLAGEPPSDETADLDEDGQQFGPYTTIRMLGDGGMGIVYLARQEHPLRRTVALKVIKPGMDSRQVIARFESERQALALMDHPHIARVFDAGEADDGRPYFVMEYVPGIPLLEYCDANRLTIAERLDLFGQICLAVHHAHQKGIIHRDLKPSNVLVTVEDGAPAPKVIDFGVAKAMRRSLTDQTMFTGDGVLIGTPEYMSPEQASLADHDVDASTDIYSLGVLLYELMVGVLPFDIRALRRGGYFEIRRTICEQEPPPPAVRLRALGPDAAEIVKLRRTDVSSLERQVRGDLEWIVLRALEKDRTRRYASASELAADIARNRNDEPVLARPPTRTYRLRKFVRKHRLGVSAAAAILVCLLAGVTVSTVMYFREQRQRDVAERQSYEANLANADALIESGDVHAARERLFQCPARLRGWEWRLLYALSDTSVSTLRATGDPEFGLGAVGAIRFAFSPDSKRLYFPMRRTVHAWDVPSWKAVADYGIFGPILGISQDGSRIVTRAARKDDPELFIVEPSSGKRITTLHGHRAALTAAFNPTSDRVATVSGDGGVRLWNARSGSLLASAGSVKWSSGTTRIVFSPDGRYIASSLGGLLRLLDARDGRLLRSIYWPSAIFAVVFSPDSRHVAIADGTTAIRIWSVESGQAELAWNEGISVLAAAYSRDGATLVTATMTGGVRVWDTASGSAIATLTGPATSLLAVAFSPDGNWILAGSGEGEVWIWDAPTYGGQLLSRSAAALAVSRDGTRIATGDGKEVTILDAASGRVLRKGMPAARALAFNPRGDRLATGDGKGAVRLLEVSSGSVLAPLAGHSNGVASLTFSPDGQYLASGSWDGTASIWDVARGSTLATIHLEAEVYKVAFSPDGKLLATSSGPEFDGGVRLWAVPSGTLVRRFQPQPGVVEYATAVAFSPGGDRLAAGDFYSAHIRIVDIRAGGRPADLVGHADGPITGLAFSSDGRLLASAAYDQTIRLWDTARRDLLFTLRRPAKTVEDLAFSPDGSKLYASYGGPLRVWSTSTAYPAEIRELVARLQREYPLTADLWRRLKDISTLDEPQRTAALRLCPWWSDWYLALREQVWGPAVYPPASLSERKLLLRHAEDLAEALPWSTEAWTILGAAQLRNGRHAEASRTLARASAAAYDDPRADAFLAMALRHLGQIQNAREALDRARSLLKDADPIPRHDGEALIAEAEALLAGRRQ